MPAPRRHRFFAGWRLIVLWARPPAVITWMLSAKSAQDVPPACDALLVESTKPARLFC